MNEKDQARIEDYLYGRMPPEQAASFEAELEKDQPLAERVELERMEQQALRLLSQDMLRKEMAAWKTEKEQGGAPQAIISAMPTKRRLLYWLSLAASVLLVIGIPFWWANKNYSDTALASEALGLRTSLTDRSNIPANNPLFSAIELARAQKYGEAIEQLRQLEGTDYQEQARLLTGEICTEQKDFAQATAIYSELAKNSTDAIIQQKSEWLLSNVFLATNQEEKAYELLREIAGNDEHLNQKDARSLLKRLNSFWRKLAF